MKDKIIQIILEGTILYGLSESGNIYQVFFKKGSLWKLVIDSPEVLPEVGNAKGLLKFVEECEKLDLNLPADLSEKHNEYAWGNKYDLTRKKV